MMMSLGHKLVLGLTLPLVLVLYLGEGMAKSQATLGSAQWQRADTLCAIGATALVCWLLAVAWPVVMGGIDDMGRVSSR